MTEAAAPPGTATSGDPIRSDLPAPGPEAPLGAAGRAGAYALVLVLTALLAVWGAFLVPLRVAGLAAPVCWGIALVGNAALGLAGGRLLGKLGALLPVLLWAAVAFTLGTRRTEGDLVVTGSVTGLGFLLAGAVGGTVAYVVQATRRPSPR